MRIRKKAWFLFIALAAVLLMGSMTAQAQLPINVGITLGVYLETDPDPDTLTWWWAVDWGDLADMTGGIIPPVDNYYLCWKSLTSPDDPAITPTDLGDFDGYDTSAGPPVVESDPDEGFRDLWVAIDLDEIFGGTLGEPYWIWSNRVRIVIDHTPPSDVSNLTGSASGSIPSWTWDPATDNLLLDHYVLTINGFLIDDDFPASGTGYSYPLALVNGSYTLEVKAVDAVGNESPGVSYEVVVGPGESGTSITAPTPVASPNPTNSLTTYWTWDDPEGFDAAAGDRYVIMPDGDESLADYATSPATVSFSTDGAHSLQVMVVDSSDNPLSDWSPEGWVNIDTTPPPVPTGLSLLTPDPTNQAYQIWTWEAADGAAAYELCWSHDGTTPDPSNIIPAGGALHAATAFGDAADPYYIWVRSLDELGNASDWSAAPASVTVDMTAPASPSPISMGGETSPTKATTIDFSWPDTVPPSGGHYLIQMDDQPEFTQAGNTYTNLTPFADGSHLLKVWAVDEAGNVSNCSQRAFEVDTTPPPIPAAPELGLNQNNPTRNLRPTWRWNSVSDPNGPVTYDVNLYSIDETGTTKIDGPIPVDGTTWRPEAGNELAEGTYFIKVRSRDALDNFSAWSSRSVSIEIDRTAPDAPVVSLVPTVESPTNRTELSWNWTAPDGAVSYEYVLSNNSAAKPTEEATPTTACTLTQSGLADGTWYLHVRAFDAAGNVSAWAVSPEVEVDTIAPDPPTGITCVCDPDTNPTSDRQPAWSWSAPEAGDVDHYQVQLISGDGIGPIIDLEDLEVLSFTPLPLADGTYTFQVRAVDYAGNTSDWATSEVQITVDAAGPMRPNAPVPDPAVVNASAPNSVTWTWNNDPGDDVTYNVYLDGVLLAGASVLDNGDGTCSTTTTGLSDGVHYLQVEAIDGAGNSSGTSERGYVTIDTVAPNTPQVTLATPDPTNQDEQHWFWTTELQSQDEILTYEYGISDSDTTPPATPQSTGDCALETNLTAEGTHYLYVRAVDEAGNKSGWGYASVEIDLTPPATPTGLVCDPATSPTTDQTPVWSWDADEDADHYLVQLNDLPAVVVDGNSFSPEPLVDGDYTINVWAVDAAGNVSASPATNTITVDTTAPLRPNAPVPVAAYTTDRTPTWNWNTVDDPHGPVAYDVYRDGVFQETTNGTTWTPSSDLTTGETDEIHYLQVVAKDSLGNHSGYSEKGYVRIDNEGPAAPVIELVSPNPTYQSPQTWTWSRPVDAVDYDISWTGAMPDTTPPDESDYTGGPTSIGNVDLYQTDFTGEGYYFVRVRARDALGNIGAWSTPAFTSVYVDTVPPPAPYDVRLDPAQTDFDVYNRTRDNTPTWVWDATETSASEIPDDVDHYEVSLDGMGDTYPLNIGQTLTFTAPPVADGEHFLRVRSVDAMGNTLGWVDSDPILVDTTPPSIIFLNPVDGDRLNINTGYMLVAQFIDEMADTAEDFPDLTYTIRLRVDGGMWNDPTAVDGNIIYYLIPAPYDDYAKLHTVEIMIMDALGNTSYDTVDFYVDDYRQGFGFGKLRFPDPPEE